MAVLAVRRWDTAAAFLDVAGPFLCRDEATHSLFLAIAAMVQDGTGAAGESPTGPAPYLAAAVAGARVVGAAIMLPPHGLVLSHVDEPAALRLLAHDLWPLSPTLPAVLAPAPSTRLFTQSWRRLSGQPARQRRAERIYQLEAVVPVRGVPGQLRRAASADRALLLAWMDAFAREALSEQEAAGAARLVDRRLAAPAGTAGFYLWHDGRPAALIGYSGPTPHGIRLGPVYTPPPLRGRGYASAGVAATSQLLLDAGRRWCCLVTDRANPTANHIYQVIGYQPVCDMDEYVFDPPEDTPRGSA